ncbi:glycosyltransferase [Plantactinospora endophytica]|uniref:glycosyltransferase n=1 Tax=Plantactinospora endophytica TaxID=673535 RepID=UPI001940E4F3|nr:glycosyltransferase [Plantactinospora endophytica]
MARDPVPSLPRTDAADGAPGAAPTGAAPPADPTGVPAASDPAGVGASDPAGVPAFSGRARSAPDSVSVADFGRAAVLRYTLTRRSDRLRRLLAERGTALLHAHFGVEGVYAAPVARALGVPLVTTLHGFDVTVTKSRLLASRKPSWVNYVAWRGELFDTGASFVCVSEHIRRKALDWGYPADRLVVLPTGVDVDLIPPADPVETPRILHIARLVEKKGTADLLRAFAVVRRAVPGAELVIVGDGPLREPLDGLARELDVSAAVRFLGARTHTETLDWLRRSRLLCQPSVTAASGDQEGLPTVLLEAAATGRPVVGTTHGGIAEAVTDGENGFLVAERDVAALADRLTVLLRDPQLCQRFGEAGRQTVVERYNLRRQTEKLESLYRSLR